MRVKKLILTVVALVMVLALAACGGGGGGQDEGANAPEEPQKRADPGEAAEAPEDETLRLTIPKMARVKDDEIPTTVGNDEAALKEHAAIHLEGTGFPWEPEANVYIAGHRLGYPETDSFLAFWDLDALETGDEITLEDANGKEYVYGVTEEFDVAPTDLYVLDPVAGKNVMTLQMCTLPDYSRRLIVQAELKG